ncbi:MAG: MoaD/ThiS family protein [Acidobacteria bacterium]|nr:MoaD/ThiS family protein [Acidobacteriota bacterium]
MLVFHIPGALRQFTGGAATVNLEDSAPTLGHALAMLWMLHPGLRDRVLTEQGQVRQHINIFIGDEDIRYSGGLVSTLSPGSEISIVPSITGGAC